MSRDTLGEYGPESANKQAPRATSGGQMPVKPIPYSPPKGPSNINDPKSPGLHGDNYGNCPGMNK
jgi:hypothetical protein